MSMGLPSARSNASCTKPDSNIRLSANQHAVAFPAATFARRRMGSETLPAARTEHFEPVLLNFGYAGRPPITQRPSGSAALRGRAVSARAEKTKGPPDPGSSHGSTRHEQSFDPLEPEAGVAHPLVELDPRHALVPEDCFQHGALHGVHAPDHSRGRNH